MKFECGKKLFCIINCTAQFLEWSLNLTVSKLMKIALLQGDSDVIKVVIKN
jgi:hypothetical protein